MRRNILLRNDAPGETRTPNLLIRSQPRLSDAGPQYNRVRRLTRDVYGPEDATKRPYPAKTFTRKYPRLFALVGALILVAILVVLSI